MNFEIDGMGGEMQNEISTEKGSAEIKRLERKPRGALYDGLPWGRFHPPLPCDDIDCYHEISALFRKFGISESPVEAPLAFSSC